MRARRLESMSLVGAALLATGLALVFFYAPVDADQGVIEKIFYIHVPMAIVARAGSWPPLRWPCATCAPATGAGTCERDLDALEDRRRESER